MKITLFLIFVIVVVASLYFFGRSSLSSKSSPNALPSFALEDYEGNIVRSTDFTDKPLVLNAWAGWCPFCVQELPDFAKAQEEFKDQVVIVAINRAEKAGVAKSFTDGLKVTDKLIFLLDPDDSFYRSIGGFSMPETLFIDKSGNIVEHKRGPLTQDEIRAKVQKIF